MSDATLPTKSSSGAEFVEHKDESLKEVAPDAAQVSQSKGKGKAKEEPEPEEEEDEDDDEDEDDSDEEEDDEDDDDDIDFDEVDPSNITAPGWGNRPSRARKPIDYSSEEAMKQAGLDEGGNAGASAQNEDEDGEEFEGDISMD